MQLFPSIQLSTLQLLLYQSRTTHTRVIEVFFPLRQIPTVVSKLAAPTYRSLSPTDRIFTPFDMKSMHFRGDHAEIVKNIAYGYARGEPGIGSRPLLSKTS